LCENARKFLHGLGRFDPFANTSANGRYLLLPSPVVSALNVRFLANACANYAEWV
jgi:hypothetical protein